MMKNIYKALLVLLFSFFIDAVTAQVTRNVISATTGKQQAAKEGTYQFIIRPSKVEYLFTTETLIDIEKNRDKKVIKYIRVAPTVEVMILPKEYIESRGFKPLPLKKHVD